MKIRGREIGFLRTVQTACDIAEMCPDKDLRNVESLFNGTISQINKNGAMFIHLMNKGYEMAKHFDDPTYEPNPISVEEIMYLKDEEYQELFNAMMDAFIGDKTTVEVEESKKKDANEEESD